MSKVNVEEACHNLKILLEQVAKGEEVSIIEQDRVIARLLPPLNREQILSKAKQLRESLMTDDEPLSQTVINLRQEERY